MTSTKKPAREARKGGARHVWIIETSSIRNERWTPLEIHEHLPSLKTRLSILEQLANIPLAVRYRARRYIPANPRRSTRRKRK